MNLKGIYTVLFAGVMLTGCVFGEMNDRMEAYIGFKPIIGHDTRADDAIPFPQDKSFNVHATRLFDSYPIITDENIRYGEEGWCSTRQWPPADLVVAAYYPPELDVTYQRSRGYSIFDYTVDTPDADILISRESQALYDDKELVTLQFERILAKIDFRVQQSLDANMKVKIAKIEICGFSMTGTYNQTGNHLWKSSGEKDSIVIFDVPDNEAVFVENAMYVGSKHAVIPQNFQAQITATFLIKVGSGDWIREVMHTKEFDTEWEPGTIYTYTLNLTDQELKHTTGITSWTSK